MSTNLPLPHLELDRLPLDLLRRISEDGFSYRQGTKRDANSGREVALYTDPNGTMLIVVYVDGQYVTVTELDSHEVAAIGDLA